MNPARDLARLATRLDELAAVLSWPDERLYPRVETVSGWSPAQHVDHVLRALEGMWDRAEALAAGALPDERPRGPGFVAHVVLLTGWIPRGRGRAPDGVRPDPRPVRHRLREALGDATRRAEALRGRTAELDVAVGVLPHPQLGAFDAKRWIRFADVHTRHHLAIIADIDRHRAAGDVATSPAAPGGEEPEYGVGAETP